MSWQCVVLILGLTMILCCAILGGLHLLFLFLERRKKSGEYKQLKKLLETKSELDNKKG